VLAYITLEEMLDGSLRFIGIKVGPDIRPDGQPAFIPKAPVGIIYAEVPYSKYAAFDRSTPLVPNKDYKYVLKLNPAKANDLRDGSLVINLKTDLELVDQIKIDEGL